jgi:hypothetical protein
MKKWIQPIGMVDPPYGSGKISRRLIVQKPKRVKAKQINYNRKNAITKEEWDSRFPNRKVQTAMEHWKSKGTPFLNHRIRKQSRITYQSIKALQRVVKKHGHDKVLDAMDLAYDVFNSSWFIFGKYFNSKHKISCVDFIKYRAASKDHLPQKLRNSGVNSWLDEFLKGEKYIEDNYSTMNKDNNPDITATIADLWRSNKQTDRLTTREDNNCITCAARLVAFAEANNFEIRDVISIVDKILSNFWGDAKPLKHSGYLVNDIFWHETVPDAYIKFGIVERRRQIEIV